MAQTEETVSETLHALAKAVEYLWHPEERVRRLIEGIAEEMRGVAREARTDLT